MLRSVWRGTVAFVGAIVVLSTTLVACTSISSSVSKAPVLQIATGLYPLAEAAIQIGQSKVEVVDIVPDGSDPRTFVPSEADAALMSNAGLVIDVGGGFQPAFERAAAGSKHLFTLGAIGDGGYPWLDPASMDTYISRIESAMAAADPPAASLFKAGAQALTAEVDSTGIDYQTTLSVCPHTTMFTVDGAFASMASTYGLHVVKLGSSTPSASAAPRLASLVRSSGVSDVFAQTWADDAGVRTVALAAGVGVKTLDTLLGAPSGGWPPHTGYVQLLEANLGALDGARRLAAGRCREIEPGSRADPRLAGDRSGGLEPRRSNGQ